RHGISGLHGRIRPGQDGGTDLNAPRCNDVTSLAIGVEHQGDMGRTHRIVFNALHLSGNTILVPLEIDYPVAAFVTTTPVARRDPAAVVPPAVTRTLGQQRLLRATIMQILTFGIDAKALACG